MFLANYATIEYITAIPKLIEISANYGKTPAQILVRWAIQHDIVVIPKSIHEKRIIENSLVFDFEISREDMERLDGFHENYSTLGWNPMIDPQFK